MSNRSIFTAMGVTAMLSVSAGAANLLTNPSFENGAGSVTFSPSTEFGGADAFALTSPSSEIPGWVWEQSGGTTGGAAWLQESGGDLFGTDGSHLLFLDPNQCIQWQDTASASAGNSFRFDYNVASWTRGQDNSPASGSDSHLLLEYNYKDTNDIQQFGVYVGSGVIIAPDNGTAGPGGLTWINGSYTFEIPADYVSEFNFVITATSGTLLDSLTIETVPEPGSAVLVGLGLLALSTRRSRRS